MTTRDDSTSDATAELQAYLTMQRVVGDLLSAFVHLPSERVDAGIDDALEVLGRFCGVDRTYVFAVHGDRITNTHEWCADGIAAEIDNLQDIALEEIAAWVEPLRAGQPVLVDDVAALGADREAERTLLSEQGIRSLLVTPMLSAGDLYGFIGFDAVQGPRAFLPGEVSLLRSVADVLTSAIVRRDAKQAALDASERMAALTRSSADLIAVLDDDGRITWASASFDRLGLRSASLEGTAWTDLLDPAHAAVLPAVRRHGDAPASAAGGDVLLRDAVPPTWVAVTYTDMRADRSVRGIVVNAHDVTKRRQVEERLAHDSLHDPLTGLGNRTLLGRQLVAACDAEGADGRHVAVAFVDLDRFKLVNDALGHEVGDALLVATADRLTSCIGDAGTVTRFGGDEFVVLVRDLPSTVGPDHLAETILAAFAAPIDLRGASHHTTVSVGIAQTSRSGWDPEVLLRDADIAMYEAKARGRNRSVAFDRSLHARIRRRADLVRQLPLAVAGGRIEAHHQPIVDLATGALVGSEALARWDDPQLGTVSPVEFIAVAEELGIIGELGEQVLGLALGHASSWPTHLGVSVNLSARQLTDQNLPDRVAGFLSRAHMPAGRLTLEVTESILVERPHVTRQVLSRLRSMGVLVALDDFGTGYSSLALLRELPIDVLKIDRSFVASLTDSLRDRRLVRAIVSIAADLGMQTTAEGIETTAQHEVLRELGCTRAQGWLFGRPVPAADFLAEVELAASA